MGQNSPDHRDVLTDRLLGLPEFSHAHWSFGNLYEAIVKVPHRVAAAEASRELPRSPFGAGSPGRHYAPVAPVIAPAASSTTGASATAYLRRNINPKLFFSPHPPNEMRRRPLLQRWYRVHALRLTASAVALAAIHQARTIRLKSLG